jgi:hypothetical protein
MDRNEPLLIRDDQATPLVRILAASLSRAAAQPRVARDMRRLRGRVGLRSTVGPQAATIDFAGDIVRVTHGVGSDVDVLIAGDLQTMGRPGTAKPKVSGAVRHPRLALGAGRVLDARPPGGWRGAVDALWDWAEGDDGRPGLLRVVCHDDGAGEHVVGRPGGTRVEVHGPVWALIGIFTGADHLGAAVLEGRVRVLADLPALSRFVGVLTRFMFDEEGGR